MTTRINGFAFFDVDETLVCEKTMFSILNELALHFVNLTAADLIKHLRDLRLQGRPREDVNRAFYHALKGLSRWDTRAIAATYIEKRVLQNEFYPFFIPETIMRLKELRTNGFEPVFVSGSAYDFLFKLAETLGVNHILATELEVDANGVYTGEIAGRCMIGDGKTEAVRAFMQTHQADPMVCHAYGDHISDAGFISLVGNGYFVEGNSDAEALAVERGWPIIPLKNPINQLEMAR
ncbi:haloacid dehalogenase-like hydrolase [Pseudovibrio axinellae]|uniref:Haloacid dehalogenase-like hydrolase n=1 Tax=Pseudovibrio axinellae TaxID=989403 RepID=A0A165VM74_9HYPH|nr:HAD-IB family hydrolase [Pseudovibrio axinellae]KZL14448.1 haloacid dehalogenase-like hydrolase [Pseudovibrio axinellae]SER85653.1 HAD-superfamily subfamily IB hydrolase, TIGR01490 [Pseudovibrio axinellae]